MGWSNVSLKDINPNNELVAEGTYVFAVRGAKLGKFDRVEVQSVIASQGEFFGQPMRFSYPDPESPDTAWALKYLKRLELATGIPQEDGEDIIVYLNRVASENGTFEGDVFHDTYEKDGEPKVAAKLKTGSVRAAA